MLHKLPTRVPTRAEGWRYESDCDPKLLLHDPHRLGKVGVVGDDDRAIDDTEVSVVNKVRCQIHVRSFFLGLEYHCESTSVRSWQAHAVGEKLTKDDL